MSTHYVHKRFFRIWAAISLLLIIVPSCSNVGPHSVSAGRLDYTEEINKTEDQQMLLSIVKGRYGETSSLLAVSGIAANIRFSVRAGIEAGFSAGTAPLGDNLITGGVGYEENPTITYVPVQGEKYVRQILTPLPLDILILSLRSSTFKRQLMTFLVSKVNDLSNPGFLSGKSTDPYRRYAKFVDLLNELIEVGVLDFSRNSKDKETFYLLIRGSSAEHTQTIAELLSLLDMTVPEDINSDIVIPIFFSEKPKDLRGIGITTRSTLDLLEILRAVVEVPEEHLQAGIAINYPPLGLPGKGVHIKTSAIEPVGASLSINYKGHWFYISENDHLTKIAFSLMRLMWSITITSSSDERGIPVLTLPVSR